MNSIQSILSIVAKRTDEAPQFTGTGVVGRHLICSEHLGPVDAFHFPTHSFHLFPGPAALSLSLSLSYLPSIGRTIQFSPAVSTDCLLTSSITTVYFFSQHQPFSSLYGLSLIDIFVSFCCTITKYEQTLPGYWIRSWLCFNSPDSVSIPFLLVTASHKLRYHLTFHYLSLTVTFFTGLVTRKDLALFLFATRLRWLLFSPEN